MPPASDPHRPGLLDRMALRALPHVPKPIMRRFAARYIAGERLEDALAKLSDLAGRGHPGILDILGENVTREADARAVLEEYAEAARALNQHQLDAYVSVKPTHFGLTLSKELALELYRELARRCGELGIFLRVEMEDHPTTDATLEIFEALREDFRDVGIVLQSRLFRTPDDIARLAPGPLDVRMVKGIYLEPESIAHTGVEEIRQAYVACTAQLFDRGARVGLATHDDVMAPDLLRLVSERGLTTDKYEFQVLLGVREPLWETWRRAGHPVRVYVPFGPEWRAYSLRRLSKNPELLRAVMRNALRLQPAS